MFPRLFGQSALSSDPCPPRTFTWALKRGGAVLPASVGPGRVRRGSCWQSACQQRGREEGVCAEQTGQAWEVERARARCASEALQNRPLSCVTPVCLGLLTKVLQSSNSRTRRPTLHPRSSHHLSIVCCPPRCRFPLPSAVRRQIFSGNEALRQEASRSERPPQQLCVTLHLMAEDYLLIATWLGPSVSIPQAHLPFKE